MRGNVSLRWIVLVLGTSCASAQTSDKPAIRPEVRGVVLESGTNQPVPDAEVSLYFLGEERPARDSERCRRPAACIPIFLAPSH